MEMDKDVACVRMDILRQAEIETMSVCCITTSELYDSNGFPKEGGLMDLRMSSTLRFACQTCGGRETCPGHFGHMKLAAPVINPYWKTTVLHCLRSVCINCHRFPVVQKDQTSASDEVEGDEDESDGDVDPSAEVGARWNRVFRKLDQLPVSVSTRASFLAKAFSNVKTCHSCDAPLPKIDIKSSTLRVDGVCHSPCAIVDHLSSLPEHVREALGFRTIQPSDMMCTNLPVPPPCVRPSINDSSQRRREDPLTLLYAEMVVMNKKLEQLVSAGAASHVLQNTWAGMQCLYERLVKDTHSQPNDGSSEPRSRIPRSLTERINGKDGRIRSNLMGKRVDNCGRTVITPDPNLNLNEVGIPRSIADTLLVADRVCNHNIDEMRRALDTSDDSRPFRIDSISSECGRLTKVDFCPNPTLSMGDVVNRTLRNGDLVLFNRQPTLHKMSIMCHRARILPYSTFRMNVSATQPYNADFDGDEMNIHVPQSEETRAEAATLMDVDECILAGQNGKPCMGIIQDSLVASLFFTQRDRFFDRIEAMDLLMSLGDDFAFPSLPVPAILKPTQLWTGKQIMSLYMPRVWYEGHNGDSRDDGEDARHFSQRDSYVCVQDGQVLSGIMSKKILGATRHGLIHEMVADASSKEAARFITIHQRTMGTFMCNRGFAIGVGDIIPDSETVSYVDSMIDEVQRDVHAVVRSAQEGSIERRPGATVLETVEQRSNEILNAATQRAGKYAFDRMQSSNNLGHMVHAGSKGSSINVGQIMAAVGQQNVDGMRVQERFQDRTLPHFCKHDFSPVARGFVQNSYLRGLEPAEFFFHHMGGRTGLIDTAIKTADTGYIQRRLVKTLEDISVSYDGTVRNSANRLIQFKYGTTGNDARHVGASHIDRYGTMPLEEFKRHFSLPSLPQAKDDGGGGNAAHTDSNVPYPLDCHTLRLIHTNVADRIGLSCEIDTLCESRREVYAFSVGKEMHVPIDVHRTVVRMRRRQLLPSHESDSKSAGRRLYPREIVSVVQRFIRRLHKENLTFALLTFYLRMELSTKKVLCEHGIRCPSSLRKLIDALYKLILSIRVEPGDGVGVLAAQSVGEPATQMTLNTFHFAGVSSKNVTLGVPRLNELLSLTRKIKTPLTTVCLRAPHNADVEAATSVLSRLKGTTLGMVASRISCYYDSDIDGSQGQTSPQEDGSLVSEYYALPDDTTPDASTLSPWMTRVELDKHSLGDMSIVHVVQRIYENIGSDICHIIHSDQNAHHLVIRIRLIADEEGDDEPPQMLYMHLPNVVLDGFSSVTHTRLRSTKRTWFDEILGTQSENEWVIDAYGECYADLLSLGYPVDPMRTMTNSAHETFERLGIEAARCVIQRELKAVIEFDGSSISPAHIELLVDTMTRSGRLSAANRGGVIRGSGRSAMDIGTFERSVATFSESVFEKIPSKENITLGVSDSIAFGRHIPIGTGAFDLFLNESMLSDGREGSDRRDSEPQHSAEEGRGLLDTILDGMDRMEKASTSRQTAQQTSQENEDMEQGTSFWDAVDWSPFCQSPIHHQGSTDGGPSGAAFSPSVGYGVVSTSDLFGTATFSPTRPTYSPTSPSYGEGEGEAQTAYSPTSPAYSPNSPTYSPTSPSGFGGIGGPGATAYSPTSPAYSPNSPAYSPSSPSGGTGGPGAAAYSPTSPTSPAYSPNSPTYSPTSPSGFGGIGGPGAAAYSPTSPAYSPTRRNHDTGIVTAAGTDDPTHSPTTPSSCWRVTTEYG